MSICNFSNNKALKKLHFYYLNIVYTEKILNVSYLITMLVWVFLILMSLILPCKALETTKTPISASVGSRLSLTVAFIPALTGMVLLALPSLAKSDLLTIFSNFAFIMSIFPILGGLACIDVVINNFTHYCNSLSDSSKLFTINEMISEIVAIKTEFKIVNDSLTQYFFYGIVMFSINFTMDTYFTIENILNSKVEYIFGLLLFSFCDLCVLHIISILADKLTSTYYGSVNMIR